MVERGVQTVGSELNDIRRENEWEKQRAPCQFFSRAPVSERLKQAMFQMCAVTNAFTFMYIETKCSQRDYK